MKARRSNQVAGFVDFPINDPTWKNSKEGGMFVRLVVVENEEDGWSLCYGGGNYNNLVESFIGDDVHAASDEPIQGETSAERFHYPDLASSQLAQAVDSTKEYEKWMYLVRKAYESIDYLCCIDLGTTGWSGCRKDTGDPFLCRYENLSAEGKELYDMIKKLYEGKGTLYLQTWLDT